MQGGYIALIVIAVIIVFFAMSAMGGDSGTTLYNGGGFGKFSFKSMKKNKYIIGLIILLIGGLIISNTLVL